MSSSLKDLQCIAVRIDEDRSETTAVVPLTHRVDRLQNYHIFQAVTNHAGRLVLLAGAPGSPTGRSTGSTGEAHCSTVWSMASAG